MKVIIKKRYYKRVQRGRDPIHYHAVQPKGIGTDVHAVVKLDPVLKKHPDLRKPMMRHEKHEIYFWGKGHVDSHSKAKNNEPLRTRKIKGVSGFWQEIKRRENKSKR